MTRKILVIDHENLVADVCRIILGKLGYEVYCAYNGESAIELAKSKTFDLAIVNNMLDGLSGIEAFQIIRQAYPALLGILLTGHANLDIVIEAMNSGFSRVCKKPINPKELVGAVTETLKIATMRDDLTRMETLLPLYDLVDRFLGAESEQAIFEELVGVIARELRVPIVSVMMFDAASERLKIVAHRGLPSDIVEKTAVEIGTTIAGKVFQTSTPVILNKANQFLSPYDHLLQRKELTAAISLPIIRRGKILGVLNVSETRTGVAFREPDIEMLSIIISQSMMALENLRFIREREENSRIRAIMEQYVSPEVSNLLMERQQDLMQVGSVQELTVLFADIRNFTSLVQHLSPDTLRIFLNSFFEIFAQTVFSSQGMLDKFMGDAVLAIFGAPVNIDNPSLAAVKAAGQIMQEFERLRLFWIAKDKVFKKIGLGIGISRGPMFLGNVGSVRRLDYTVIGRDVNIAQRLAAETKSGQILLTDQVFKDLDGEYAVHAKKKRKLRGMESLVTVYALLLDQKETLSL